MFMPKSVQPRRALHLYCRSCLFPTWAYSNPKRKSTVYNNTHSSLKKKSLHSGRNKLGYTTCSVDFSFFFYFFNFCVVQRIKPRTLCKLGKALPHWTICSPIKCIDSSPLLSFPWAKYVERRDLKAKTTKRQCHCPVALKIEVLDRNTKGIQYQEGISSLKCPWQAVLDRAWSQWTEPWSMRHGTLEYKMEVFVIKSSYHVKWYVSFTRRCHLL